MYISNVKAVGFLAFAASAFSWFVLKNNDASVFFGVVTVASLLYHVWWNSREKMFDDINYRFERVYDEINGKEVETYREFDKVYNHADQIGEDINNRLDDDFREVWTDMNEIRESISKRKG
jgi:hypothetical protein